MIHYSTHNGLCLIEMADGKVNFLSLPLRVALLDALVTAEANDTIRAIVLAGRGRCFCAGMNVDDFEAGTALTAPSLHNEILDCLANLTKPVVAAIHGGAHGGGLELALGCHYRVAAPDAEVSLPEVLVGLMPGARGTQHLPRAVGLSHAADMILNGKRLRADTAPAGLIDEIVSGDLIDGALAFARNIAEVRPIPHLQNVDLETTNSDASHIKDKGSRRYPGIEPVVALLGAAATQSFEESIAQEFDAFCALKDSEVSVQFRAAFMAKLKAEAAAKRKVRQGSR